MEIISLLGQAGGTYAFLFAQSNKIKCMTKFDVINDTINQ